LVADIETSVAITARTDGLQSGLQEAAAAVGSATGAMKVQFAELGSAAQSAQASIGAAAAQIGSTISELQAKAANLSGAATSIGGSDNSIASGVQFGGISVREQSSSSNSADPASRFQIWRNQLQGQLAEEQSFYNDSKAEELAFWQDKLALTEAGSKDRLAVETNIYQLEKQLALQNERDSLASLDGDEKVADAIYARRKAAIEEQSALGRVSASEEVAQLSAALDDQWALTQDYYEKKLSAAGNDSETQQKLTEQQELAYQKYLADKDKLDAQAVDASQKQWQSLVAPIQRTLDTSITGLITGTLTVQKALADLARSIVSEFVNAAVGNVLGGLGKTLGFGGLGADGAGSDQDFSGGIVGAGGAAVGGGISEGIFGSGGLFGALGLGGLFSSGGLFGGLFKGLGALFSFEHGGIVPSAAGGWMVPNTSLALLHTNEMVLPANISQGLQSMINGSGAPSVNATFAVSAMDSQSVATFFKNNGATLVAALNQAMRNGAALRGVTG
jgi:hypothetical protein